MFGGFCYFMVFLDFNFWIEEFDKFDYLCINNWMKICDWKEVIVFRVYFNCGYFKDDYIIGNLDFFLVKFFLCV